MIEEESNLEIVNRLVLELSLVTAQPIAAKGRNYIHATASASAMAFHTSHMNKKDLRAFEWTIGPLISLLIVDIEDPVATKAALALRSLMASRVCMGRLLESGGLNSIARTLDIVLNKYSSELRTPGEVRNLVEHLGVCYREVARFYPWELVNLGSLRHCVLMLRFGDVIIQTASCATLASMSKDLEICKQMFSYGAIKPLLNVSDAKVTNDACMLAGLGCIVQLCQIREIAARMVQIGVVPVLESALHKHEGFSHQAIREKALYALGFLAHLDQLRTSLCTSSMLEGIRHEFHNGTLGEQTTILQLLQLVHNRYSAERETVLDIRDDLILLLKKGPWHARYLSVKAICVLYQTHEDRLYLVENGLVEAVFAVIDEKGDDLQEAPIVCFLYLCTHPHLPTVLINKGVMRIAVRLLYAEDAIIRELCVVLLRALVLYNPKEIQQAIPPDKQYLLQRDEFNPQIYGGEYGGMIEEYLQEIVENRRDQAYLMLQFDPEDKERLKITDEELESFQNTFMELDVECKGWLGLDELKMLIVLMGEELDREELDQLLKDYDLDHSGNLDFYEFVYMMKDWNRRFGEGWKRTFNQFTKRGPVGKAARHFKTWWHKDKVEKAQIAQVKQRKLAQEADMAALRMKYMPHEQLNAKRDRESYLRAAGISSSPQYSYKLPPIK
eukprot:gene1713-1872_t